MSDDQTGGVHPVAIAAAPRARRRSMKPAIAAAILKCQAEVRTLPRNEHNNNGHYDYVSVDRYYEEIVPVANRNGLFWHCELTDMRMLPDERISFQVLVDLRFIDGTIIEGYDQFSLVHPYMGAQTTASVRSYADKIFMRGLFKVPTGEGDADTFDVRRRGPGRPGALPPRGGSNVVRLSPPPPVATPDSAAPVRAEPDAREAGQEIASASRVDPEPAEHRVARMVAEGNARTEDQRAAAAERVRVQQEQSRLTLEDAMSRDARQATSVEPLLVTWQRWRDATRRLEVGDAADRACYGRIKQVYADRKAELLAQASRTGQPSVAPPRPPPPFRAKAAETPSKPDVGGR